MPALSKKQQKFFGIVRAIQKGEQVPTTPETAKAAADMKKGDVKKFASTKHKGLPEKKVAKEEYGNPKVGPALKMARLIDKTKPGPRSKRTKISQYLKRREMEGDRKKFAAMGEENNPRIPRKKGQPANSKKHSDLYTDENPKGTIHGLGFKDVSTAKASVSKIRNSSRSHAHKIQAAVAMEQRAREMGKTSEAAVYRKYINSMKKKTKKMNEAMTDYGSQSARDDDDNKIAVAARKRIYDRASTKDKNMMDARTISQQRNKVRDERMKADQNKPEVDSVGSLIQKKLKVGKFKKMNEAASPAQQAAIAINMKKKGKKPKDMNEGSLHKWFKGSKSKDGKGGWVNVVTGGTCASDEPGEGTPKCVSSAKRASMSKSERLSAARRKKKADPGQQQKTGAAKPTYVSTDSPRKKKMKESYGGKGVSRKAKLASTHPPTAQAAIKNIPTETDRGSGNKAKRRAGMPVEKKSPTYKAYAMNKEETQLNEVKDKKGKGSGSKDACYHKVKSRYSVWPSAYASGALVKCRKVGAANWGNSSKKEEFEPTGISFQQFQEKCWKGYEKKGMKTMFGKRYPNCVKKEEVEVVEAKYEAGASTYGKATIRNKRKFGTSGELPDPMTGKKITKDATRGELISKRREEHKAKRGMKEEVKVPKNVKKIAKELDKAVALHASQAKRLRKAGVSEELTGWRKDIGYEGKDDSKKLLEDDMKGMSVKSGHKRPTKSGAGMTKKGVEAYRRRNPGSKLQTAVTTKPSKLKKGSKAANRRKSYCARSAGQMKKFPKAAKDPNSRLRQARRRWNC